VSFRPQPEPTPKIVPTPYVGHVGVVVAPGETLPFMVTLPESTPSRVCLIVDPFVVGGTTAVELLQLLIGLGIEAGNIRFLTLCMSRAGYERLRADQTIARVRFFCGRIDGQGRTAPNEDWIADFEDLNERLFRTINRDEAEFDNAK
jgi:uracil phosphoribosyltransferase